MEKVILVCDKCSKPAEDRIFVNFAKGGQMTMDLCKKHMTVAFGTARPERDSKVKDVPLVVSNGSEPLDAAQTENEPEYLDCPDCDKRYKGLLGLNIHRARAHGYTSDKPYNIQRREKRAAAEANV